MYPLKTILEHRLAAPDVFSIHTKDDEKISGSGLYYKVRLQNLEEFPDAEQIIAKCVQTMLNMGEQGIVSDRRNGFDDVDVPALRYIVAGVPPALIDSWRVLGYNTILNLSDSVGVLGTKVVGNQLSTGNNLSIPDVEVRLILLAEYVRIRSLFPEPGEGADWCVDAVKDYIAKVFYVWGETLYALAANRYVQDLSCVQELDFDGSCNFIHTFAVVGNPAKQWVSLKLTSNGVCVKHSWDHDDFPLDSVYSKNHPLMRQIAGSLFKPGDLVETFTNNPLHCGSGIYKDAVVVSTDPFILISQCGDMQWSCRDPEDFRVVGTASKEARIEVNARIDRTSPELRKLA